MRVRLLRNANDSTSRSTSGIARRLALLVSTFSEVIGTGMHDDGPSKNTLGTDELHEVVGDATLGIALSVGLEVA